MTQIESGISFILTTTVKSICINSTLLYDFLKFKYFVKIWFSAVRVIWDSNAKGDIMVLSNAWDITMGGR